MYDFISKPMGWILARLSELCSNNFALSVLIFTVLVNLIMLPLTIKSQKSTAKQAKIKPKMDALKKKYGNDKQKYSMAVNELYAKENVSMSGGCLPMIVRLMVMMGVYWAVVSPLTYVVNINTGAINAAKVWTSYVRVAEDPAIDWNAVGIESVKADPFTVSEAAAHGCDVEYMAKVLLVEDVAEGKVTGDAIKNSLKGKRVMREVEIVDVLTGEAPNSVVVAKFKAFGGDLEKMSEIDFRLFGLDLAKTPKFSWNFKNFEPLWIIPLLSFATAILSSLISMKIQKKANPDAPNMAGMMLTMPIISLVIAFGVPGAVGFYWACSNVISGGIQSVIQLTYGPNAMVAREQSKTILARAKVESAKIERVKSREDISE